MVRTPQSASGSLGSHPPELQTLLYRPNKCRGAGCVPLDEIEKTAWRHLVLLITWPGPAQGRRGGRPRALSGCMVSTPHARVYHIVVHHRMRGRLGCCAGAIVAERGPPKSRLLLRRFPSVADAAPIPPIFPMAHMAPVATRALTLPLWS